MRSLKLAVLYGVLAWLASLLIEYAIGAVLNLVFSDPLSLMLAFTSGGQEFWVGTDPTQAVVLTIFGVLFSVLYFRKVERNFIREGIALGLIWFAISTIPRAGVEVLVFGGQVGFVSFKWLWWHAFIYLIYPVITIGFGWLIKAREEKEVGMRSAPNLPGSQDELGGSPS